MLDCSFDLNGKEFSDFVCDGKSYQAFSGMSGNRNSKQAACVKDIGPIPPGTYYIVDRQSGGLLGWARDYVRGTDVWFALYADDGTVDDETFCDKVSRGNFRLHPKGPLGISKGCITIEKQADFDTIRALLLATKKGVVPGTKIDTYGKVTVTAK